MGWKSSCSVGQNVALPGPASAESLLVPGGLLQPEYLALRLMLAHILKENSNT